MNGIKVVVGLGAIIGVLVLYGANGVMVEDESDKPKMLLTRGEPTPELQRSMSGGGGNSRTKAAPVAQKDDEDYDFFRELAEMVGLGGEAE